MFHVVCLCAVSKVVTLLVSEPRHVQVNAGSRRLRLNQDKIKQIGCSKIKFD